MKKKFILIPLVGALLYVVLSGYSEGPYGYAGIDATGANGSTTGCNCHAPSAVSSTVVTVQLLSGSTPVTSYTPGGSYTLKISGTNTSTSITNLTYFGFQLAAVTASTAGGSGVTSTGSFGSAPSLTRISTSGYLSIWEHGNSSGTSSPIPATSGSGGTGTTYVETIPWTAPSAGTGSVVIYGVLNAVNHNGSDDANDLWNLATPVTICEQPSISSGGTTPICQGATAALTPSTTGGTWSSGSTGVATVSSGTVTAVATGSTTSTTSVISYSTSCGTATKTVTVSALPPAITASGSPSISICQGVTVSLTGYTAVGTWTSASTGIATVNLITGSMAGVTTGSTTPATSVITFTGAGGCPTSSTVTVNPLPAAITSSGSFAVCQGGAITLSDALPGGTWSSGSTGVATIGSTGSLSAILTGSASPATSVITYTSAAGCTTTATVTVNPLPATITGTTNVCAGATTTLSDPTGTGAWTSGSPSTASVVSGTGVVTGAAAAGGTAVITFALAGTGCSTTTTVSVNPSPGPIGGTLSFCAGGTTSLSDAGGGTWTSGSAGIATVGSTGLVTGVSPSGGTSVITYAFPATGCAATAVVTVNAIPGTITGTTNVCPGSVITLGDATSGGSWTSGSPSVATIDGSGNVTGIATVGGTSLITYGASGCSTTTTVTVNPSPSGISGLAHVCLGSAISLTDAGGGSWSSASSLVSVVSGTTGTVTGVATGTAVITYTLPVTGCNTTTPVTVDPLPAAGTITGTTNVCVGASVLLNDGTIGGVWSSSTPAIAIAGSTGHVTGVSAGTDTVSYSVTNICGTAVATAVVTVNPLPLAGTLSGLSAVCSGAAIPLSPSVTGGAWTSSNSSIASVGSTGSVSGVSTTTASANISYTVTNSCGAAVVSKTITVNPLPAIITASTTHICTGSTLTLTDATAGGAWTSSNTALATIGSTGSTTTVTGTGAGNPALTYTLATGCSRAIAVTVNPTPGAISGAASVCEGSTITLSDTSSGGAWSVTGAAAAVGSGTGIVTGLSGGSSTIKYSFPATGCASSTAITVSPISPIAGLSSLCAGLTTTLSDAAASGSWVSDNTSAATIGSSSGFVTAAGPGVANITFTTTAGCTATATMTIISSPSPITGTGSICQGSTTTLIDAGGGAWSSSATGTATVGSTGVVTGVSSGATSSTATITYSLGTGCTVSTVVTVNAVPPAITGAITHVCPGATLSLSETTTGGSWSSSNTDATVGSTGASTSVTGISAGTDTILYALPTGCSALKIITVNPLPSAINGTLSACQGATTSVSDTSGTGTWGSSLTSVATVVATTGLVTGITTGSSSPATSTITYTRTSTGCAITAIITVNPLPATITGTANVCPGATTTLSDATSAGTWSSSAGTGSATVSSSGVVTGVTSGTATVTYTSGPGCKTTRIVTVNTLPGSITGTTIICGTGTSTLSDASSPGGTWSISPATGIATVSTSSSTTALVTATGVGPATISYTLPATSCSSITTITVNPSPASIAGTLHVCLGSTTALSDTGSGAWSSASPSIATVGSGSGIVTGVSALPTTITYTLPDGCKTTAAFIVNPLPSIIGGSGSVCIGAATSLTEIGGGSWSVSNANATIGSTGSPTAVTGISAGADTVTYTLPTGCFITKPVTVNPLPLAITGPPEVCQGATTTLADASGAGTWNSSATGIATVSGTGTITGIISGSASPATATIGFMLTLTGCSTSILVTVNPLPSPISGTTHVCTGVTTTLTDGSTGTWSSGSPFVAIGATSGTVTGLSAGVALIEYTLGTGCLTSILVTVNASPVAGTIAAAASSVCPGAHVTLSDTATGGIWSSGNISLATIGSSTGIATGVAAGTDTIAYTVTNSCGSAIAVRSITINPLPVAGAITGSSFLCMGSAATLTDASPGGTWSSRNAAIAVIGSSTGTITTIAAGIDTFVYSVTNICGTATAMATDTIIALPTVDSIAGLDSICVGGTINLTNPVPGGIWTSSNGNATIDSTGLVTGITAGAANISYSVTTICGTARAQLSLNIKSLAACNTGVNTLPVSSIEFKVYPNPSGGTFTIQIPETAHGSFVTIMDVLGKVIETRAITDNTAQNAVFNLKNVALGTYLIRVDANNIVYRDKIVIW